MKHNVVMPSLGPSIEHGILIQWLLPAGAFVKKGTPLFTVETDKSIVECEATEDGWLTRVLVGEGATAKVTDVLAELETEAPAQVGAVAEVVESEVGSTPVGPQAVPVVLPAAVGHRASPRARRLARESGLDAEALAGSGVDGRVHARDVIAAIRASVTGSRPVAAAIPDGASRDVPLSSMRRAIATRLAASARDIPVFHTTMRIRADALAALRKQLRDASEPPPSINDLVVKACALTLMRHPKVNATFHDEFVRQHASADIAVAVAVEDGLITPLVRNAQVKHVTAIAAELRALRERATTGQLRPEEYQGGTFTVSNLGMFGVDQFTAIINPPQCAILAVGAIDRVAGMRKGVLQSARIMNVTLTADHRAIDGAIAAAFLADLRSVLEAPARILL